MNKNCFIKVGMVLMTVILAAGIVLSCDNGTTASSEKELLSITIKDKEPDNIPEPISSSELADGSFTDPSYTGTVYLNSEVDLASVTVSVTVSAGANAEFGLASGFDAPVSYSASTTLPVITLGQALYVKVTAADGSVNYYRFSILLLSDNSSLRTLTVADMGATLGAAGTTWNNAGAGTISLSNGLKQNAKVVGTPGYARATIEYTLMTTSAQPTGFSDVDTYTFADGNTFWVRVTAENGQKFSYYKFSVQIGRDATLASIAIGSTTVVSESLGTPKSAWGAFTASQRGTCQADERMPATGFTVTITPTDEEATAVWAPIGTTDNTTTAPTFDGTSPHIFPSDASDIAIKVTSSNGSTVRYYRVRLITKSFGTIYKGTPSLINPGAVDQSKPTPGYIDPIWLDDDNFTSENGGWLDISRVNTAESYDNWFALDYGQHTKAKARVLWDDDGIWVYCDADFYDYKTSESAALTTRTASLSDVAALYRPGKTDADLNNISYDMPSNAHTRDSLELFVNERFQAFKSGNYGEQYRSGLPNADGTIWLSGEKPRGTPTDSSPPPFNTAVQFQMDNMVNAWIKMNGAKQVGYVIIMRARWIKGNTDPKKGFAFSEVDRVFDADGNIVENAEIGLELQINACAEVGTRNGILTWNGVTSQAYQNVKSFGIVQLKTSKTAP